MASPSSVAVAEGEGLKRAPDGVIRVEVDKISSMPEIGEGKRADGDLRFSPEVLVRGVPWVASVWREVDNTFGVKIESTHTQSAPHQINWDSEAFIVHPEDTRKNVKLQKCRYDWDLIFKLKDVVEKGFMIDDKVSVDVHLWIKEMKDVRIFPRSDFTDPDDPFHDVALVIEGEKVYVNKGVLASHSSFFKSMFYGPFAEKDKKEIELKDVNREEFIEMLHVIYPSNKKITNESVECLLKLGDRFDMHILMDRAIAYLMDFGDDSTSWKIPTDKLLKMADQCNISCVKKHVLFFWLCNDEDFKKIEESPFYSGFSEETIRAVNEKKEEMRRGRERYERERERRERERGRDG